MKSVLTQTEKNGERGPADVTLEAYPDTHKGWHRLFVAIERHPQADVEEDAERFDGRDPNDPSWR